MKKNGNIYISLIAVLLVAFGIGCALSPDEMKDSEKNIPVLFTEEDNGRCVKVNQNEVFDIALKANPTTGYTWEIVEPEDDKIIEPVDQEYHPDSDRIGSPGIQTYHFKAVGKGRATIRIVYRRPWEKKVQAVKEFELHIHIKLR